MNEMSGLVTRMRELGRAVGQRHARYATERGYIQTEFSQLRHEINRISAVTEFNGQKLLDGSRLRRPVDFQVGIQNTANDRSAMSVTKLTHVDARLDVARTSRRRLSTVTGARNALGGVRQGHRRSCRPQRSKVGAVQNRMQVTISNLSDRAREPVGRQLAHPRRRRRPETSNDDPSQILSQAGLAVLAQANQLPSAALSLLG
jgi:flagellin